MSLKPALDMLKESFKEWKEDDAGARGGARLLHDFSIAPLLLIVIAVAGLVWGQEAAQGQIYRQFDNSSRRGGAALQTMVGKRRQAGRQVRHPGDGDRRVTVLSAPRACSRSSRARSTDLEREAAAEERHHSFIMTRVVSLQILGIGFCSWSRSWFSPAWRRSTATERPDPGAEWVNPGHPFRHRLRVVTCSSP